MRRFMAVITAFVLPEPDCTFILYCNWRLVRLFKSSEITELTSMPRACHGARNAMRLRCNKIKFISAVVRLEPD